MVGDVPIAVVYCPLCDSVTVVDRRVDGKALEFGVSGLLLNSNVLLYDRTDNALWSQIGLGAISGPHVGQSLKHLSWHITSAGEVRKAHASATVVTTDTGHTRDYSMNPYENYFSDDRLMFPVARRDERLPVKARVVGVRMGDIVRAYPLEAVKAMPDGTLTDLLGPSRLMISADRDGGVRVIEVPPETQVAHTFWFAWAAFQPKTEIFGQQ